MANRITHSPKPPTLVQKLVWIFARFDGRIGREVYWLANIALVLMLLVFLRPLLAIEIDQESGVPVVADLSPAAVFVIFLTTVSTLAIGAKRLHDFGATGFFSVALLLFPLSALATLVIGIIPGSKGPNRFGDRRDRVPGHS